MRRDRDGTATWSDYIDRATLLDELGQRRDIGVIWHRETCAEMVPEGSPSFEQVLRRPRKASRQSRPGSLLVPPLTLRFVVVAALAAKRQLQSTGSPRPLLRLDVFEDSGGVGEHSAKPPEIRSAIERMYPDFDSGLFGSPLNSID